MDHAEFARLFDTGGFISCELAFEYLFFNQVFRSIDSGERGVAKDRRYYSCVDLFDSSILFRFCESVYSVDHAVIRDRNDEVCVADRSDFGYQARSSKDHH